MMTKRFLIVFSMILIFISCEKRINDPSLNVLIPKENIKQYLDSFVLENRNNKYIYELYINKKDPFNYDIIIYGGETSLTKKENDYHKQKSIVETIVEDVKFDIYSGVEHFFYLKENDDFNENLDVDINNYIIWVLTDSSGKINCYKENEAYPFLNFPIRVDAETFIPPIIESE